jgi:DNA-directed RNA polymerase specialized sigma24 family protein
VNAAKRRTPRGPKPPTEGPFSHLTPEALAWLAAAFPWLVRKAFLFRIPRSEASDVAQLTIIAAALSWDNFRAPPNMRPDAARRRWVWGIFANCTAHAKQGHYKRQALAGFAAHWTADPLLQDDAYMAQHDAERLLKDATTPERWRVWFAHEIDGQRVPDLAHTEGAPVATIWTRIRLARLDFAAAIKRDDARLTRKNRG